MSTFHGNGGRTNGRGTPIEKTIQPAATPNKMTYKLLSPEEIAAMIGHYPPGKLKAPVSSKYIYQQHKAGDRA